MGGGEGWSGNSVHPFIHSFITSLIQVRNVERSERTADGWMDGSDGRRGRRETNLGGTRSGGVSSSGVRPDGSCPDLSGKTRGPRQHRHGSHGRSGRLRTAGSDACCDRRRIRGETPCSTPDSEKRRCGGLERTDMHQRRRFTNNSQELTTRAKDRSGDILKAELWMSTSGPFRTLWRCGSVVVFGTEKSCRTEGSGWENLPFSSRHLRKSSKREQRERMDVSLSGGKEVSCGACPHGWAGGENSREKCDSNPSSKEKILRT